MSVKEIRDEERACQRWEKESSQGWWKTGIKTKEVIGSKKKNGYEQKAAVHSHHSPLIQCSVKQTSHCFCNYAGAMDRGEKMAHHSPKWTVRAHAERGGVGRPWLITGKQTEAPVHEEPMCVSRAHLQLVLCTRVSYLSVHARHWAPSHRVGDVSVLVDVVIQQILKASITKLKQLVRICRPTSEKQRSGVQK